MRAVFLCVGALSILSCGSLMAQTSDVFFPAAYGASDTAASQPITLVNCDNGCATDSGDDGCGGCGGWIGGFDIPFFDVFANHAVGGGGFDWFEGFTTTPAGRYWFGYQNDSGIGFRGRFFHFNADGDVAADRFNLNFIDAEATADLTLNDWQFLLLGGLRVGELNYADWNAGVPHDFDGAGLTVGVEARRLVGRSLGLVAGFRQSYLLGHTQVGAVETHGTAIPITELKFGGEWYRPLSNGATLVATAAYEHQIYSGLSVRTAVIDPEDVDVSLSGPVFSLSLLR